MPKCGGYLNLDECEFAQISDILMFRKAYLVHSKQNLSGDTRVKSYEQMDEHERLAACVTILPGAGENEDDGV